MKTILSAAAFALLATTAAFAQQTAPATPPMTSSPTALSTAPGDGVTVANYYKQNVYDSSNTKIGEVVDVLLDKEGHVTAFIVSVGGFLGMGNKDVAVPFQAILATQRDNKWTLVMDANKDALKSAPGYKYDRNTTKWVSDKS